MEDEELYLDENIAALPVRLRVRLETWNRVMHLLQHYRDLESSPLYTTKRWFFERKIFREARKEKLKLIHELENKLFDLWESALGADWLQEIGDID